VPNAALAVPAWSAGSAFGATGKYRPREPERTVLHAVVAEHLETFLHEARGRDIDGQGVPDFVEDEFRKFLGCGSLSGGLTANDECTCYSNGFARNSARKCRASSADHGGDAREAASPGECLHSPHRHSDVVSLQVFRPSSFHPSPAEGESPEWSRTV
jgi:hypothetical protein